MKLLMCRGNVLVMLCSLSLIACSLSGLSFNRILEDDFSNSQSNWGVGTDSQRSVGYVNDGLQMIVHTPYYMAWSSPDTEIYENVHMEVSVINDSTDPEALFGFTCNEQYLMNVFYYIGVSPDGYYAFIKSSLLEENAVFLKEGTSTVISDNPSSMRLGADCAAGMMTLYVNGQQIDSVTDSESPYTSGLMGLFAASDDETSGVSVIFDDFLMTKLDK